jgi:rfaE bifunctional protein kinase chain/domain
MDDVARMLRALPADARTVFVSGNFNVLHPGHMRLLQFAADCGDFLIVGVNPAGSEGAFLPEDLRLEAVRALACVNAAFLLPGVPSAAVRALKPSMVVKGHEHQDRKNPEAEEVAAYGGRMLFASGDVGFSSRELVRQEFGELVASPIELPTDFPGRYGFSAADLSTLVGQLRGLRVLVIGDLIVDDYIACDAVGLSREDPTIVVTPVLEERFIGGAGIVAAHAAGLGGRATFISVTGDDEVADWARERLIATGVDAVLIPDQTRPTTLKQRFRAAGKTLLRVNRLKQHSVDSETEARILFEVTARLATTDLIIFSDFNYGALPQRLVEQITEAARQRGIAMAADSQSSSQVGDISRFKDMLLLKPTEHEARLAMRDFQSGLVATAEALRLRAQATYVCLSLGGDGVLIHTEPAFAGGGVTDQLPAFNRAPKDVAGAGDCFLIATSMALARGADIWRASYLGSVASALQVGRIGNVPLEAAELIWELAR